MLHPLEKACLPSSFCLINPPMPMQCSFYPFSGSDPDKKQCKIENIANKIMAPKCGKKLSWIGILIC